MKTYFGKDAGSVVYSIEDENWEQDVLKCQKIKEMMKTEGWTALMEIWMQGEKLFHNAAMRVKPTDVSARECQVFSARDCGFTEAVLTADNIIKEYDKALKIRRNDIEEQVDNILGREEIYVDQ